MTTADVLYSAARVALFDALLAPRQFRQIIVNLSAALEAEAILRGARPSGSAMHRISVV